MSKSRKILGAILALVFVLNVFAVSAFAAGALSYEADGHGYTQAWVVSAPQNVSGNQYQVTVSLATNYKVGPVSFFLEGVTSIDDIAIGTGYYAGSDKNGIGGNGLVLLTPNTMDTVPAREINGAVAVVTYTTANANGAVTIANNPKTAINPNGTLIAARVVDSETVNNANFVAGQTVTSITVGGDLPEPPPPAANADIQVKAGVTGIQIDTAKTFQGAYSGTIYGFTPVNGGADKVPGAAFYTDVLEATNGGSLEVVKTPYIARPASWGTGTVINVKNADGSVAKTYVVVIFGDVDGDGAITTGDVGNALSEVKVAGTLPEIKRMAANVTIPGRGLDADDLHTVGTDDLGDLLKQVKVPTNLNFVNIAEKHFAFNVYYQ